MVLQLEIVRHSALLAHAAPIRHAEELARQVVVPLVIRTLEALRVTEVGLAELHAAMRASIFDDVDRAVLVADHDDLALADECALEVARVRNLDGQSDVTPVRSVEEPLELARVERRVGEDRKSVV